MPFKETDTEQVGTVLVGCMVKRAPLGRCGGCMWRRRREASHVFWRATRAREPAKGPN